MSSKIMLTVSEEDLRQHLRRTLDPFIHLAEVTECGQEHSPFASMLSYLTDQQEKSNNTFIEQLEEKRDA
ncbi:hypothetical protein [Maridesulfovibrio sp.]|uniref:hypothetical protein n=1 Tax=Maridesulfovibrio sp. TaxID=2795000 RepID=UPI003BA9CFD7